MNRSLWKASLIVLAALATVTTAVRAKHHLAVVREQEARTALIQFMNAH